MKYLIFILALAFSFLPGPARSQTKQKAEKEFLKQLNSILKKSKQQHWAHEGTMTIDSAYAISKAGILSVTVRYTNDTSFVRVRMEAPVSKIVTVAYDLYIILEYKDKEVTVYESEPGSNDLKETGRTHMFHIGMPLPEDVMYQEDLQKVLDNLLKYYQ